MSTNPQKQCSITNQTSKDVVVLVPVASATSSTDGSSAYGQNLDLLTLEAGGTVINAGASGTVTLDQTYIDPTTQQSTYALLYDLLISKSDWYFPVANISVMQNIFATPRSFSPVTVTPAQDAAMQNANIFYQTISAYPTSQLAKNYQAAMSASLTTAAGQANGSSGSSANAADSLTTSANAFFAGTKQFQNVTLGDLAAIQSYFNKFPFAWANFGSVTYYLYNILDAPSGGQVTNFAGTLTLTPPPAPNITLPNGGYTVTYTPSSDSSDLTTTPPTSNATSVDVDSTKAVNLTFSDGLFADDITSDNPAIALKGTFKVKSFFTQKSTDNQIIIAITGTVGSWTCLGFDSPQLETSQSNEYWNTLFHPKTSAQKFQTVMTIAGAVMVLGFVISVIYNAQKFLRARGWFGKPTNANELADQQAAFEKALSDRVDAAIQRLTDAQQAAPADAASAASVASAAEANMDAADLTDALQTQSDSLEVIGQYEELMDAGQLATLESLATRVSNVETALNGTTDPAVIKAQAAEMTSIQSDMDGLRNELDASLTAEDAATLDGNSLDALQATKEVTDQDDDVDDDFEPDTDFAIC